MTVKKPTKTLPAIRWRDGTTTRVHKRGSMWTFNLPARFDGSGGGEAGSNSLWGVKDTAEFCGGEFTRVPNPHYAQELKAYEAWRLRRLFRLF